MTGRKDYRSEMSVQMLLGRVGQRCLNGHVAPDGQGVWFVSTRHVMLQTSFLSG